MRWLLWAEKLSALLDRIPADAANFAARQQLQSMLFPQDFPAELR